MNKKLEITYEDAASLMPNTWNPNKVSAENELKIEKSLDELGAFKPVIVRELADGTREILGGEHRAAVYARRGEKAPVINLGQISDDAAKKITLADNARYGSDDSLALQDLLSTLDSESVLETLPYSEADLHDLMGATTIDLESLNLNDDEDEDDNMELLTPEQKKDEPLYKVLRVKLQIDDIEAVEELLGNVASNLGLSESDRTVNYGLALKHVCDKFGVK